MLKVEKKKGIIDAQVEQRTIYEEDDCLHCGLCTFSSKSKKNMLRHSNIVHGVVINDKVRGDLHCVKTVSLHELSSLGLPGWDHHHRQADGLPLHALQVQGNHQGGAGTAQVRHSDLQTSNSTLNDRKRTIHNKYGGVTAVDPIAEAEERKARIRNNCL